MVKEIVTQGISFGLRPKFDDVVEENTSVQVFHVDSERDDEVHKPLSQYNLNYIFDAPDDRDYKFASLLRQDVDPKYLPPLVDLRSNWGQMLDQGNLGSCVSNSVTYQLRYILRKNQNQAVDMSRLFIYYNGRLNSGYPIAEDTGLTMRQGFISVQNSGAAPETEWPYDIAKFATKAPASVYTLASANKTIGYYSVAQDLSQLRKCLKDGFLISFGIALFDSFMSATVARTGQVPVPQRGEQRIGGHAMTIVGYDHDRSVFIVANSWGDDWGDNGFCYIPYSMILDRNNTGDFWSVQTYSYAGAPTPAPTPTPAPPAPAPVPSPTPTPTPSPVVPSTVPNWRVGQRYRVNDLVTYANVTYRCTLAHRALASWIPPAVPALWHKVSS